MSVTVSPPVRLFALVGILGATALGAFLFIVARPGASEDATLTAPVTSPKPAATPTVSPKPTSTPKATRRPRSSPLQTKSGFPSKIDRALQRNRVVVVVVYMPGSSVDRIVLAEARAGAIQGRAAYVPVSALNERVAGLLVAKTGVLPQPAVLVLRRPGIVTTTFSVTDSETVAQAVALARR